MPRQLAFIHRFGEVKVELSSFCLQRKHFMDGALSPSAVPPPQPQQTLRKLCAHSLHHSIFWALAEAVSMPSLSVEVGCLGARVDGGLILFSLGNSQLPGSKRKGGGWLTVP